MEKMPKILIVDDDSNMRILVLETLEEFEDYGIELLTAENGEEALEIIKTKKPDLVILDVMMQGINGFEVCKTVKNILELRDTYILLLTAKSQYADRHTGYDVGADGYMTKPFVPDELTKVVSKVLSIEL
jgi:two-component system alkaline phosphatase synthesis response regulator PhoP